jgi:hypothetical protein
MQYVNILGNCSSKNHSIRQGQIYIYKEFASTF